MVLIADALGCNVAELLETRPLARTPVYVPTKRNV
jgi:hypothetical protein